MAVVTSSQVSKRRPARASERKIFHHGSIKLRQAASFGWNTISQRGWASMNNSTSVLQQQHVGAAMAAQVVGDRVDPLDIVRQPALDRLQEGHPVGGPTPRVGSREGGSARRAEGAKDIALATPPVVDFLASPACVGWLRSDQIPSQVALGTEPAHLVQAHD